MKLIILLIFAFSLGDFSAFSARGRNSFLDSKAFSTTLGEADDLIAVGYALYQQKKYDEAIVKFQEAIAIKPEDFRGYALSGFTYMAQWKLKSASESFAKAIALKPDNESLYLNKAQVDIWRNEREEAVATCRQLLKINSTSAKAYLLIGEALQTDEKRRDEAEAAFRAAVKADPNFFPVFVNLGNNLLFNKKDEKGAEEYYRRAMESDPKKMAGRFELGRLMVEQNRLTEARQLWEAATEKKEQTFPNFITVLERAEKLQQATDALAKKPADPPTLLAMGNAVMEGDSWVVDGRQEKAIVHYKKALQIKPDFAAAQAAIVKAYIQMADTNKNKNKNADEELARLKKMDASVAKEMETYRKNYSGGLKTAATNLNQ